ncbi:hypothetical protein E3U43_018445 [Larimichthys crocea]|uniref:Uncharacterized protein n=1 Tax=Larimichthys crocea TaxID=215358 RepID=A0ACD3R1U2_LARCR|nr:hypothetical protein E3U43_018445 [Larimichthys crocea]
MKQEDVDKEMNSEEEEEEVQKQEGEEDSEDKEEHLEEEDNEVHLEEEDEEVQKHKENEEGKRNGKEYERQAARLEGVDQSDTEFDGEVFEEIVKESPGTFKVMLSKEELDASLSSTSSSCSAASDDTIILNFTMCDPPDEAAAVEGSQPKKPCHINFEAKAEHYYDPESGSGYLAWRLKTIQQKSAEERGVSVSKSPKIGGPSRVQPRPFTADKVLSDEDVEAAIAVLKHSADEDTIREKMKATFIYRQPMVNNEKRAGDVFSVFPIFLDTPGLIEQDFRLLFGEATANKFLEKWANDLKTKVITESHGLVPTTELLDLMRNAESTAEIENGWDSDMSAILLLLHLLPPSAKGRKRPGKVSACQAVQHLIRFIKTGTSVQQHLDNISQSSQPYLLAQGPARSSIHTFFIVIDKYTLPCKATGSVGALDELFKAHYVFGTSYSSSLAKSRDGISDTSGTLDTIVEETDDQTDDEVEVDAALDQLRQLVKAPNTPVAWESERIKPQKNSPPRFTETERLHKGMRERERERGDSLHSFLFVCTAAIREMKVSPDIPSLPVLSCGIQRQLFPLWAY